MDGELKRTKTGIAKLDKALNGGIPFGNVVLISGGAGTGKSTFALQYLVNGANLFGEKGLYISTEQSREELIKTAKNFGWDLESMELSNKLKVAYFDVIETDNFLEKIYDLYTSFQPKRVVIDSLTTLVDSLLVSGLDRQKDYSLVRIAESVSPIPRSERIVSKNLLYHLMKKLRLFDSTVLLTSELFEEEHKLSADGISEFICDGVVVLHYLGVAGSSSRVMRVRKMRYTQHEKSYMTYTIDSSEGIKISEESMDVLMK
jgi:circadian clock protein KaiC